MILFLDTVSPIPEFSIIEGNKIIFSKIILNSSNEKMSDCILPIYKQLDKRYSLRQNIKFLIITTGPGSYTALRVGLAFFSGLSISMKIPLIGISCVEIFNLILDHKNSLTTALYIISSNNQKFIYLFDKKKQKYYGNKIEKNNSFHLFKKEKIIKILTNHTLDDNEFFTKKNNMSQIISFKKIILKNIKQIILLANGKPIKLIYISNNQILN